ncbi:hypothetical protein HBH52_117930 [Parastagonospora nodorum]|nr:hypothetical protein HBH52_117930 [Parastagonospora nodorum]
MPSVIESNETAIPPEQKYFTEAAKRLKKEGTDQFEELHFSTNERLRSLAGDPWADHAALDRLPLPVRDGGSIKFLITGTGFGGIIMAIKLVQAGFTAEQIVLVEAGGGVGGTWYWNRYPGLHCDVESYCYMPFLEETGYMPKQKYSSGVEIRRYMEYLVEHFGLKDRIIFRSQVRKLQWDGSSRNWQTTIKLGRGPDGQEEKTLSIQADFVTLASGLFPYPQVPRVPGLADFKGQMFHTSRWDYGITGGSYGTTFPEMEKLKGLRVGVIGTGATAIQIIPLLAKYAQELYIFQRTPSHVHTRGQKDTDPKEWREKIAAKPGWQKERVENLAERLAGHTEVDLVNDNWSRLNAYLALIGSKRFGKIAPEKAKGHIDRMLLLDSEQSKKARARIPAVVKDGQTAEKLTAWYPTWCKRPTFSDVYLETFNNENVHLIDTDGKGIQRVTPNGIVANGQEYPVDILILSTGYRSPQAGGDPGSRTDIEVIGRDDQKLSEKWEKDGVCTLHGVCSNGFPNFFWQSASQAGATANYSHIIDVMSEHIAGIIAQGHERRTDKSQKVVIETSKAAEDEWGMRIAQDAAVFSAVSICTPGYMNLEGEAFKMPDANDHVAMIKKAKAAVWWAGLVDFTRMIEEWRSTGDLNGLQVTVV